MKNRLTRFTLLIAVAIISLFACKKETQVLNPTINSASSTDFKLLSFYSDNEDGLTQNFNLNSSNYMIIYGVKGTKIVIQPFAFEDLSGNAISGNVEVELIEIMDIETMVLTNKSTNGKMTNGDVSTLLTGGQIKLNITQGGNQLKFKSGYTYYAAVPTANTGLADNDMNKFTGRELIETNGIIWENEDTAAIAIRQDTIGTGGFGTNYTWSDSSFGWTNIDKWYSDPRQKTTIEVQLPAGYDNTNASVFIAYKNEPRALASFDRYDQITNLFTEHYGLIPIGLEVHFIVVAKVNGQLQSSILSKTITNNHLEVIPSLSNITKAQLTANIIALP